MRESASDRRLGDLTTLARHLVGLCVRSLRPSSRWAYVWRVLLAFTLALYAAYWLEIDSPYSAGTTVLVLMNTSRGAVISKSIWRLVGSLAGVLAAIALIAAFAQTPLLFIVGLAAWLAVCSAAASLLRYFRGYSVVLAGYTVSLVAFGAIAEPEHIFDLATARLAVVAIGVVATAMVFLITDRGPGRSRLQERVAAAVSHSAAVLRDALLTGDLSAATEARSQVALELTALDQMVEFAAVEDAGSGRFAGDLRFAVAQLFATLPAGLHAIALVRQLDGAQSGVATELAAALERLADPPRAQTEAQLSCAVRGVRDRLAKRADACRDVAALAALDQSVALLDQFGGALTTLHALWEGVPVRQAIRLPNYINFVTAARNGLRAGLAVLLAGLFWVATGWTDGSWMLVLLGVVCALASQFDSAARASVDFMKGTLLAIVCGLVCAYGILPRMSGFPLLLAGVLPFIAVGVFLGQQPRFAVTSLGFLVFFIILVAPGNPIQFDLARFLNISLAFILGSAWAVLSFRVLLQPDHAAEARAVAQSIRDSVQRLACARRVPHVLVWEHPQHQKMVRLSLRLATDPAERARAVASGAAAIVIGRHLLSLRQAVDDEALSVGARAAALRTVAQFRRLKASPAEAAAVARVEAAGIESAGAPASVLHMVALLRDLAQLVTEQAGFLALESQPVEPLR